jgi:hypothetical protein
VALLALFHDEPPPENRGSGFAESSAGTHDVCDVGGELGRDLLSVMRGASAENGGDKSETRLGMPIEVNPVEDDWSWSDKPRLL